MKFIVKKPDGTTALATFDKDRAEERLKDNPSYKLLIIPEER